MVPDRPEPVSQFRHSNKNYSLGPQDYDRENSKNNRVLIQDGTVRQIQGKVDTSQICQQMRELAKHNSSTLISENSGLQTQAMLKIPKLGKAEAFERNKVSEQENKTSPLETMPSARISSRDELGINEYYKRSLKPDHQPPSHASKQPIPIYMQQPEAYPR